MAEACSWQECGFCYLKALIASQATEDGKIPDGTDTGPGWDPDSWKELLQRVAASAAEHCVGCPEKPAVDQMTHQIYPASS